MTLSLLAIALVLSTAAPAQKKADPALKLKPGAQGPACLVCHNQFKEQLQREFVHTPVKGQQCTGCHSPHATQHGKLLSSDKQKVCITCHTAIVPASAKSTHKPVAQGACVSCHDPHASANKANLVKPGAELCSGCHKELVEGVSKAKVQHAPVQKQGCTACHEPHGSTGGATLLKADVPGLCLSCHDSKAPQFTKSHLGYPVQQARCTGCHDPHGSNQAAMLYDTVHKPVASRNCSQCHELPTAEKPFATRRAGLDLCRSCHAERVAKMLDQPGVHQPVLDRASCTNCHNPHASKQAGLLAAPQKQLCGNCHADTLLRQERSPSKHKPIAEGQCVSCHDPHASSGTLLLAEKLKPETCAPCHEKMSHSTHPLGPKFKDPRNKNLTLDCLSCHRAHGTEYRKLIPFAKTTELCTKCHEQFRR
jgi:DmsE family decaheme c-type cytochrome